MYFKKKLAITVEQLLYRALACLPNAGVHYSKRCWYKKLCHPIEESNRCYGQMQEERILTITRMARIILMNLYGSAWEASNPVHVYSIYNMRDGAG